MQPPTPLPLPAGELRDTTGAGDTYAAGFLYGYTQGLAADQCGQIASLAPVKW